jgi:aerobic-type carbon monoxide dehydrogenase small subunit (CoxS/CutS family)
MLASECQGKAIETVEGMSDGIALSPIQQKFFENDAVQCGWCTPGFLMAAKALLAENSSPSLDEVRAAMGGHICTCQNLKLTLETIAGGV